MPGAAARDGAILVSGVVILAGTIGVAVTVHRSWSWPLFIWGAAVGVIASAWAFYSTRAFARSLMKQSPGEREALQARADDLWRKYRATYASTVAIGFGVGIISGGVHSLVPDAAFTGVWVLLGVLPPLIAFPALKRRAAAGQTNRNNAAG